MLNGAIIHPSTGIHPCPELDAIIPLLRRYQLGLNGEVYRWLQPYGYPFLHDMEKLTIEGHSNIAASNNTSAILALLLIHSPLLRHIELKDPPLFRDILWRKVGIKRPLPRDNVEKLSLWRACQPQDDMAAITASFPNLVFLHAEFRDGSCRPPDRLSLPPEVSEALLHVSGTLETLSLTTSSETCPAKGRWVFYESYLSSLTTLNHMNKLKNLTTESIWLFGTKEPATALQLSHLLPQSLVHVELIDYWGNDNPAEFYPEFPNSWTPLEFYTHVFESLCNECLERLPELRAVTFSRTRFNSRLQIAISSDGQAQQDQTQITEESMETVRLLFQQVGVVFRLVF